MKLRSRRNYPKRAFSLDLINPNRIADVDTEEVTLANHATNKANNENLGVGPVVPREFTHRGNTLAHR